MIIVLWPTKSAPEVKSRCLPAALQQPGISTHWHVPTKSVLELLGGLIITFLLAGIAVTGVQSFHCRDHIPLDRLRHLCPFLARGRHPCDCKSTRRQGGARYARIGRFVAPWTLGQIRNGRMVDSTESDPNHQHAATAAASSRTTSGPNLARSQTTERPGSQGSSGRPSC